MKTVICINWGTKYGAAYINRLYRGVARNITPPFRFVAFSDVTEGLMPGIDGYPLPDMPGFVPERTPGQWQKARLWAPQLADIDGPFLFLDLDVIVTGNLDAFFEYGTMDKVTMAHNVARPLERMGQSSVYRAPVGKLAPLQDQFAADPQGTADKYRFEQHFVTKNAPGGIQFWPKGWVRHFRIECIPTLPMNFRRPPYLPKGTKVVIFAGGPNPPEAIEGRRNSDLPNMSPREYLSWWWKNNRRMTTLQDYALPAPWIADYWDN